jgi:AcrR family transcriptional regulator
MPPRTTEIAMAAKPRARAPRGLDKNAILDTAFDMLAAHGESGFSIRKLGAKAGIDPMTVLHHFGSKERLLRCIADRALTTVPLPPPTEDWQHDLRGVAKAYRDLARRYPRLFHLHFRFHATGPADHVTSEVVYRAMRSAGLPDSEAAGVGLAFYAFVLGCGLAETEGLLQPLTAAEEAELKALDQATCPATLALIPAFKTLNSSAAYAVAVDAFIAGIALRSHAACEAGPSLKESDKLQRSKDRPAGRSRAASVG